MEKIYMEESKKQKRSVMNLSVALSFVVSIFAIFSLAMYGIVMNQGTGVSYAAPEAGTKYTISRTSVFAYVGNSDTYTATDPGMNVNNYYNGEKKLANQVFCIERRNETQDNAEYEVSSTNEPRADATNVIDDPGLIYLLGLGQSGKSITDKGDVIDGFVLQSAIWYYLAQKTKDDAKGGVYKLYTSTDHPNIDADYSYDDVSVFNAENIWIQIDRTGRATEFKGFKTKIQELYTAATNATVPSVSVNVAEGEATHVEKEKYYQSPLITVVGTPANSFENYSVSITGIDDMITVNENGQEISRDSITAGTKFYVRIPEEKVTKESQTVQINVTANFTGGSARYNIATNGKDSQNPNPFQRLATVYPTSKIAGAEFVVTPNTGMNVAQTIYFVGLIVLLCGVGIVYANAKPVEAKQ